MARVDVLMPQMGESIAEGTLSKWLKKVGDPVKRDEPLFEISTDKVDAEIPAPAAGVLAEIKVQEGQTVPVQTLVAVLETDAGAVTSARPPPPPPRPSQARGTEGCTRTRTPTGRPAATGRGSFRVRPSGRRRGRRGPDRRATSAHQIHAPRSQDRGRAQRRHFAHSREWLRGACNQAGHPWLHRTCPGGLRPQAPSPRPEYS